MSPIFIDIWIFILRECDCKFNDHELLNYLVCIANDPVNAEKYVVTNFSDVDSHAKIQKITNRASKASDKFIQLAKEDRYADIDYDEDDYDEIINVMVEDVVVIYEHFLGDYPLEKPDKEALYGVWAASLFAPISIWFEINIYNIKNNFDELKASVEENPKEKDKIVEEFFLDILPVAGSDQNLIFVSFMFSFITAILSGEQEKIAITFFKFSEANLVDSIMRDDLTVDFSDFKDYLPMIYKYLTEIYVNSMRVCFSTEVLCKNKKAGVVYRAAVLEYISNFA